MCYHSITLFTVLLYSRRIQVKDKVLSEERLTKKDALKLFETDEIFILGKLASHTDSPFHPFTEVHITGGLHPDWPFEYYLEMLSKIKKSFSKIHIKAFTATEIDYISRISGKSIGDTLVELKRHGLDTIPGGGAEILSDRVREIISPRKIKSASWLKVMEEAHRLGMRTTATMMFGGIEKPEDIVEHLDSTRNLQDRTGGFTAFIPWTFQPQGIRKSVHGSRFTVHSSILLLLLNISVFLHSQEFISITYRTYRHRGSHKGLRLQR